MSDTLVRDVERGQSNGQTADHRFSPLNKSNDADAEDRAASAAHSREAGRWAEAFQKNVLARHDGAAAAAAAVAEPQPSCRPTPHRATTTQTATVTMVTATATAMHGDHNASRSQSQSMLASPTPSSVHAGSVGNGSDAPATGTAIPRVLTSRPAVSAVAVHPPLSRHSKRAAMTPAGVPAARSASLSSTSMASYSVVAQPASHGDIEGRKSHARSLPPPPPPTEPRANSFSASVTATPNRASPTHAHNTPHTRFTAHQNNNNKVKPLSQLQLQSQRGNNNNSNNSPLHSAATPHIPCAYASSPFFQRVKDAAGAAAAVASGVNSPLMRASCEGTVIAQPPHVVEESTPHVVIPGGEGETGGAGQEDSGLLQEVTPIMNSEDSWRHDSQLLSQPRESAGSAAAAAAVGAAGDSDYFTSLSSKLHRLPLPPPLPVSASSTAAGARATAAAYPWSSDGSSSFQQTSPYQPAIYFDAGYGVNSSGVAQGKPSCVTFTSPYTPGNGTRLSASPGGLSGSHNATMNTTTYGSSGMTSGVMLPSSLTLGSTGAAMENSAGGGAALTSYLPSSSASGHLYHAAGGVLPCLSRALHMSPVSNGGDGASPLDFRPQQLQAPPSLCSLHGQSPPPAQSHSAVTNHGEHARTAMSYGPAPTVSGTTATVATAAAAIASGLSGIALEKQLLHASKEELVQILLELGSCNPEASRFIDAKAFFFAFRHEHSHAPSLQAAATTDTQSVKTDKSSDSPKDEKKVETQLHQSSQQGQDCVDRVTTPVAAGKSSGSTTSSNHSIARCIFPAESVGDAEGEEGGDDHGKESDAAARKASNTVTPLPPVPSPPAAAATLTSKTAVRATSASGGVPERRVRPEERAFCADVHPCLRWYGACRNATSCIYAGLPRNLCLNWVRGACVARTECSGVHRLPDPCPSELQRIYLLNHGVPRSEVGHALHALSASPSSSSLPTQQQQQQAQAGAKAAALATAQSRVEVREVSNAADSALHTPCRQSIHNDAFAGGGDTPHRHHRGGRGGAAVTKAVDGLSPWTAMDVCDEGDREEASDVNVCDLPALRMNGAVSPAGSSCSTAEDRAMSDYVSRCLGHDFDSAVTPLDADATATTATTTTQAALHPSDLVEKAYTGRRSPVMMSPCAVKEAACVLPLHSVAAQVQVREAEETEEEDYADFSAPAAGTRTRVQSPLYV